MLLFILSHELIQRATFTSVHSLLPHKTRPLEEKKVCWTFVLSTFVRENILLSIMADTEAQAAAEAAPATVTPKKGKAAAKKPAASPKPKKAPKPAGEKKAPTHPPTATLVNEAIARLNERGGSSLQAIKKSIAEATKLDVEKLAPFIRKYLKSAVEKGTLVQVKGKGASGSFKLAVKEKKAKPVAAKKPKAPKAPGAVKVKKPAAAKKAAKPKSPKKPAAAKKAPAKPKAAKPAKTKSPAKPKAPKAPKAEKPKAAQKPKAAKAPAEKKPKAPKAAKPKAAAPKKAKAPAKPKAAKATKKAAAAPATST